MPSMCTHTVNKRQRSSSLPYPPPGMTRLMLTATILTVWWCGHPVDGFLSATTTPVVLQTKTLLPFKKDGITGQALSTKPRPTSSTTQLFEASATASSLFGRSRRQRPAHQSMSKLSALLTKVGMMAFIISMCIALPIALLPQALLHKLGWISRIRQEQLALSSGQFCARWLLRLIPFCHVSTKRIGSDKDETTTEPSIWVCNHTSALDVFILLAKDKQLRGTQKRPIKIVYWQGLEENPVTRLLFRQCGFIPVQMAANAAGEANDYDMKSFRHLLKMTKQAFEEGFDIGILPEGQLNPHPEQGLLPCFSGAYTLAKMSKRPIQMMALHGTHRLWHAKEDIGMTVTGREVGLQWYRHPPSDKNNIGGGRKYTSPEEFLATFSAVVGEYATTGTDLDDAELEAWLDGSKWKQLQQEEEKKETKRPQKEDVTQETAEAMESKP